MDKVKDIEKIILKHCCPVFNWSAYVGKSTVKRIADELNLSVKIIDNLIKPELRDMASGPNGIDRDSIYKIAKKLEGRYGE